MSCSTLNQAFVSLNVSMGALPEGFCPSTMQDLANSIATRLIVTPNQAFSTFAIGSVEPSSNIGPWLKDCVEWWIFDDATARYIPLRPTQFTRMEVFDVNGTWENTFNVDKVIAYVTGGGGGGGGSYGGGGGGGGFAWGFIPVVNTVSYSVAVGIGGASQIDGVDSSFQGLIGRGGKGALNGGVTAAGGAGGGSVAIGGEGIAGNGGGPGNGSNTGGAGGGSGRGGGGANGVFGTVGAAGQSPGGGGSGGTVVGATGGNGRVVIIY